MRALPRSQHHAGGNQQDPRHADPCDGLMQHKHTGQQVSLDVFPFSHICAEASLLDKFILAEPVAPPKYLQIAAPLCQRTESGKVAGQRNKGLAEQQPDIQTLVVIRQHIHNGKIAYALRHSADGIRRTHGLHP